MSLRKSLLIAVACFAASFLISFLLALVVGCSTTGSATRSIEEDAARRACHQRCSNWTDVHDGYQLFLSTVDGNECVCRVMSPNAPDMFEVRIPGPVVHPPQHLEF